LVGAIDTIASGGSGEPPLPEKGQTLLSFLAVAGVLGCDREAAMTFAQRFNAGLSMI
jgi:hypothetical protein